MHISHPQPWRSCQERPEPIMMFGGSPTWWQHHQCWKQHFGNEERYGFGIEYFRQLDEMGVRSNMAMLSRKAESTAVAEHKMTTSVQIEPPLSCRKAPQNTQKHLFENSNHHHHAQKKPNGLPIDHGWTSAKVNVTCIVVVESQHGHDATDGRRKRAVNGFKDDRHTAGGWRGQRKRLSLRPSLM